MARRLISRTRDGRYRLRLDDDARALLSSLATQLDPLLDDPAADPGLRRLFPPARTDDLLAEAQWQIEQGEALRDARRATLGAVREMGDAPLSEDELIAWMQGVNALRLVLAERLGVAGDEQAEHDAVAAVLRTLEDEGADDDVRAEAMRTLQGWQVYDLLGLLVDSAVRALD